MKLSVIIGISIIAISSLVHISPTYATRVDDVKDSPKSLYELQDYNKALKACFSNNFTRTFTYTKLTQQYCGNQDVQTCRASGFDKQDIFLGGMFGNGTLLHSNLLEKKHGSYFGGDDNGTMFCGEKESEILDGAMQAFGTNSADKMKSLFCASNGGTGIYTITKLDLDNNVVESDCNKNYDQLLQYIKDGNTNPQFTFKVEPSGDAVGHFNNWFRDNVGDLGTINEQQNKAANYARAASLFKDKCVEQGPRAESFENGRDIQLWDTFSGQGSADGPVYYSLKPGNNNIDYYLNVDNGDGLTCKEIAEQYLTEDNAKAYAAESATSGETIDSNTSSSGGNSDDGTTLEDACYDSGVVSMGWLVCPAIQNSINIIDPVWKLIEDMLQVNTTIYSATGDERSQLTDGSQQSATYKAWDVLRNVANVVMVIFFIVIIFSQVTGYGIDNYGIKKLLPKVIIAAVMINMSYIICEIIVDLSNIIGVGLKNLFVNITHLLPNPNALGYGVDAIVTMLFGAAGVVGLAAPTIITVSQIGSSDLPMVALIIGLALLVAVVAILMFFVMLGARTLIIIGCIILSPIAFACNMLPNTQGFFKKWWKVMEACLVIYPICGAVYGLAEIMKCIIFGGNGGEIFFWEGIAAIIVPFLPFFFIPTMLKSALAGMGAIGAALTGMSTGVTNGIRRGSEAIQNTERMRNRMADAQQQTAEKRATKVRDAMLRRNRERGGTDENLDGLTRGEKRRLNDARKTLNQGEQLRQEYNRNTGTYFAASESALRNKAFEEEEAAYSSLLSDGNLPFNFGDDENPDIHNISTIGTNEGNDREKALIKELSDPNGSEARAMSIYKSLAAEGKEGYDSIARVMNSSGLQRNGAMTRVLNEMKSDMAIKDKAPGLYKAAMNIRSSKGAIAGGQVEAMRNSAEVANNIKAENVPNLTAAESAAFFAQTDAGAAGASLSALTNAQTFSQMNDSQKTDAANQVATHIINSGDAKMAETFLNSENAADYLKNVDGSVRDQIQDLVPTNIDAGSQAVVQSNVQKTLNDHVAEQAKIGPSVHLPGGASEYAIPVGFRNRDPQNPHIVEDDYGNKYDLRRNIATMANGQNSPNH